MKKAIWSLSMLFLMATVLVGCYKECECPQSEEKTLTTQPGPDNGQDCLVAYRETDGGLYANSNLNSNPDMSASRWTYNSDGAGEGTVRTYFRFPQVSDIPQSAVIRSAKLSLYGISTGVASPEGNSVYPGSPYSSSGTNACWLKRVTGSWDESTIKWSNKPATTDVNQVEVPASTSKWNYNVTDIDVTQLVKDMVSNSQNFGFVLQLQGEQIYRSLNFASSEVADASKRPKLVVVYEQ